MQEDRTKGPFCKHFLELIEYGEYSMVRKELRDKLVAQALNEISFARHHKQGKIKGWQKNEDLYYGKKKVVETSRSNVDIASAKMQEYVSTFMSKIDAPLIFKFTKRKDAQKKRVDRLNALRQYDSVRDDWNIKDLVGKLQMILYGRAIYGYSADSSDGYQPNLESVDVYDFLIDPSAGGIDMERAAYLGRYGIVKYKEDLKQGVKDGLYIKTEVADFLMGEGNAGEDTQEETNKKNRTYGQRVFNADKELDGQGKYVFWEWYTTFEGKRYYLLMTEQGSRAVRVEALTDMFASNMWPFWSYAALIDMTEFWTPSFADFVREIFMAQSVSVNQLLDNAEAHNKPMKMVDVSAVENLAELKYRKDGVIRFKTGSDLSRAIRFQETPNIDTPSKVYEMLDLLQEKASGITAGAKGIAEEDKVGIYEGNAANAADRFGLVNKSYAFGYKRFADLYKNGVYEHLNKKTAIDILGPNGVEVEEVSKRDIFRKNEDFGVMIESSAAETTLSSIDQKTKLQFLLSNKGNPAINAQKATEMEATIAGFEDEELRQLLDVSEFGDSDLMSEAERDIEAILDGEDIQPNRQATAAYKQRFVDFMLDHEEDLIDDPETVQRLYRYIDSLTPIIMQNTAAKAQEQAMAQPMQQPGQMKPAALPNQIPNDQPQL